MIQHLTAAVADANAQLERATQALAPKHVGGEMEAYEAAYLNLMIAERQLAEAEGRPYAVLCNCPVHWDVGAPLPTLIQSDQVAFLFFLLADDEEAVGQLQFQRLLSSSFGAPNDETFEGHPLHGSGFEPYRAMRVVNSKWVPRLEKMNSVHQHHDPATYASMEHFIFPFHDTTFECVAKSFSVSKVKSRLSDAVRAAVGLLY